MSILLPALGLAIMAAAGYALGRQHENQKWLSSERAIEHEDELTRLRSIEIAWNNRIEEGFSK